jgi:hypothetical protein
MRVLVSMATDGMICLVSMYLEVWFTDTTAGEYEFILNMNSYFLRISIHMHVYSNMNSYFSWILIHMHVYSPGVNRHKKELFVMAVRTPCEKTFPGNFTIIPSSKKWVFHALFHLTFLELYGDEVCSMNCLVLTDEEDAEYGSFKSLIATNEKFKKSNVMLCIFHAKWQPLKRDIYPLCPRKSKKGKPIELSKIW